MGLEGLFSFFSKDRHTSSQGYSIHIHNLLFLKNEKKERRKNVRKKKMNSVYYIIIRHLSTQQNYYKLVVISAGCGGLACA